MKRNPNARLNKVNITVYMDKELLGRLDIKRDLISRNAYLLRLIERDLNAPPP